MEELAELAGDVVVLLHAFYEGRRHQAVDVRYLVAFHFVQAQRDCFVRVSQRLHALLKLRSLLLNLCLVRKVLFNFLLEGGERRLVDLLTKDFVEAAHNQLDLIRLFPNLAKCLAALLNHGSHFVCKCC